MGLHRYHLVLPLHEQKKVVFEVGSAPGEDAMKTVAMATKDVENDINVVGKAADGFEKIGSNSKRSSPAGEMLSDGITCHREVVHDGEGQSMWPTSLPPYFKKWPQPPHGSAPTTLISALLGHTEARPPTSKKKTHRNLR